MRQLLLLTLILGLLGWGLAAEAVAEEGAEAPPPGPPPAAETPPSPKPCSPLDGWMGRTPTPPQGTPKAPREPGEALRGWLGQTSPTSAAQAPTPAETAEARRKLAEARARWLGREPGAPPPSPTAAAPGPIPADRVITIQPNTGCYPGYRPDPAQTLCRDDYGWHPWYRQGCRPHPGGRCRPFEWQARYYRQRGYCKSWYGPKCYGPPFASSSRRPQAAPVRRPATPQPVRRAVPQAAPGAPCAAPRVAMPPPEVISRRPVPAPAPPPPPPPPASE